jgi:hypothetical protein
MLNECLIWENEQKVNFGGVEVDLLQQHSLADSVCHGHNRLSFFTYLSDFQLLISEPLV